MSEESGPTGLACKSAISLVASATFVGTSLLNGILVSRVLGAEGKGAYALIMASSSIAALASRAGLPPAVIFYLSRRKWPPVSVVLMASATTLAALGLVLAAIRLVGLDRIGQAASLTSETTRLVWLFLLTAVPAQLEGEVLSAALMSREWVRESMSMRIVFCVLRLLLTYMLVVVLRHGILGAVWAEIAASNASLALVAALFIGKVRGWPAPAEKASWRELLGYGATMQASQVLELLGRRGDLFLVNYYMNQAQAGAYSVAMNFAELSAVPTDALGRLLLSRFSLLSEGDRQSTLDAVHRITTSLAAIWTAILAGLALLIPVVFGADFAVAIVPAWVLLAGCPCAAMVTVLRTYLLSEGKPGAIIVQEGVAVVVMLTLDVVLIPRYGLVGAAVAYGVSVLARYIAASLIVWRLFRFAAWRALVMRRSERALLRAGLKSLGASVAGIGR